MGNGEILRDKLFGIFYRQRELMADYEHIEAGNGLLLTHEVPVELNCRFGQARLKDFAWRMTEELGESLNSYESFEKFNEELADALHFLVEFTILAGIAPEELLKNKEILYEDVDFLDALYMDSKAPFVPMPKRDYSDLALHTMEVIKSMAIACNLLKNRPWKTSYRETSRFTFSQEVQAVWYAFISLTRRSGIVPHLLYLLYMGKAQVNETRQQTGY